MSDEAFARRFYSDRAELTGLGVPLALAARRVHRRGAVHAPLRELLPRPPRPQGRRARRAPDGALLPRRQVRLRRAAAARAPEPRTRPARVPGGAHRHRRARPRQRSRLLARARGPSLEARDRRSRSSARSSSPTGRRSATRSASARSTRTRCGWTRASGTSSARISTAPPSAPSASRASAATSASPPAASATSGCRPSSTSRRIACRDPGRSARSSGSARIAVQGDTAWWVHRTLADAGVLADGVFATGVRPHRAARRLGAAPERPRDPARAEGAARRGRGRARPAPRDSRRRAARRRRASVASTRRPSAASGRSGRSRPSASACCRRCSPTSSPPAARAATQSSTPTTSPRASRFPREELQDTLSLLNLVNFGGGCYTVYAEVDEDAGVVRVDKELYGDVFRRPPKLTPLEARAIRLAIDYVGPTIAAEAHTPLARVRKKLEETFGQFDLPHTPADNVGDAEEELVRTLSDAVEKRRRRRDRVPEGRRREPNDACGRAVLVRARAARVARAHLGSHRRRAPHLPSRPDALGAAHRRVVRAARRLRPALHDRAATRAALALTGRRTLEGRAWRQSA